MKKLKSTLLLLLSCLFVSVFAFTGCTDTNKDSSGSDSSSGASDSTDTSSSSGGSSSSVEEGGITEFSSSAVLQSISVDTSSVKTGFSVGETFSYSGLVVEATAIEDSVEYTLEVTDYEIDYSEYDSGKVGEYTIYISYSVPETTAEKYANYTVTVSSVLPAYANIDAVYSGTTQYTYSGEAITVDLSSENLAVTSYIGDDSTALTSAAVTDYTLSYSKDSGELVELEGTSLTITSRGQYSVQVSTDYTVGTETTTMVGQFIIYVVDAPASFAYNSDGTTAYGEDPEESDIGADWTYTLTLASGATETLSYSDVTIDASTSPGSNTATVTYVDEYTCYVEDAEGNSELTTVSTTYTAEVAYTVEGTVVATNVVLNIGDLVTGDSPKLTAATYTTGVTMYNDNATSIGFNASSDGSIVIESHSKSADDGSSFTYRLKLGGTGKINYRNIEITTAGACTITVYMLSSSSSSTRTVNLYDSTFTTTVGTASVDGGTLYAYTYTVTEASTYYLAASGGGANVYGILVTY